MSSSRPHRCDEFPAEYSLASCSPAELASASSASLMLQPTTPFVEQISANGNRGTFPLSQLKGSPQCETYPRDASTLRSSRKRNSRATQHDRPERASSN
jgi:hypothetical protein